MPLFESFKSLKSIFFTEAAETKAIAGTDYIGRTNPLNIVYGNATPEYSLNERDAQLSAIFYTIVNSIQTTAKSIPWGAYKLKNDENAKKVPDHELGKLAYRPNKLQSWSEFVTQYLVQFLKNGNVFIYADRPTSGLFAGQSKAWYLMPETTEIVLGDNWQSPVKAYRVPLLNGGYDMFKAEDVLHIKGFSLDGARGLSPLQAAALPMKSLHDGLRQRIKQMVNGGPPTVFFNDTDTSGQDEGLTEPQEQALVRKINRPGKLTFLNNKVGSHQIGLSLLDLDILNSINADAGMVAGIFNYPAILLSGSKSTTFNNYSEAQKTLYNNCVIPLLHELRNGLNYRFGEAFGDEVYLDLDLSGIEVLKPNLSDLITAASSASFLTINEQRKMVGAPAVDGGNGFLRSAAVSYVAKVNEETPATPAPTYDDEDEDIDSE